MSSKAMPPSTATPYESVGAIFIQTTPQHGILHLESNIFHLNPSHSIFHFAAFTIHPMLSILHLLLSSLSTLNPIFYSSASSILHCLLSIFSTIPPALFTSALHILFHLFNLHFSFFLPHASFTSIHHAPCMAHLLYFITVPTPPTRHSALQSVLYPPCFCRLRHIIRHSLYSILYSSYISHFPSHLHIVYLIASSHFSIL
jgi:hypothetical protein